MIFWNHSHNQFLQFPKARKVMEIVTWAKVASFKVWNSNTLLAGHWSTGLWKSSKTTGTNIDENFWLSAKHGLSQTSIVNTFTSYER